MIKKTFPIINLILMALMVYLAVGFVYQIAVSQLGKFMPSPSLRPSQGSTLQTEDKKSLAHYASIDARNIFGAVKAEGQPTMPEVDLDNLKKTDLALALLGTISGLGRDSYAIIEETKKHQQDLYKIGDTVSGATIKLVLRKKVVLSINGEDEVLEMAEDVAASGSGNYKSRRPGGQGRLRDKIASRAGRVQNVALSRGKVDTAFNDVNDLMKDVRIRPHFTAGKADGLSVSSIAPDSIFKEMGLRNNDVIVGVNGQEIRSVDDCMNLYRDLKSSAEVMLEVKRGGKKEFIKYNIN